MDPSNEEIIVKLRELYAQDSNPGGTHAPDCWRWHPRCCALLLAHRLENADQQFGA